MRSLCLLAICMTTIGCANQAMEREESETIYLWRDISDPVFAHVYVLNGNQIVLAKYPFATPRNDTEPLHYTSVVLDESREHLDSWNVSDGTVEPPFPSPGPWYSRIDYDIDSNERYRIVYYKNTNDDLARLFDKLWTEHAIEENAMDEPPTWVSQNQNIMRILRLAE